MTWSELEVNELLHVLIKFLSSILENENHSIYWHKGISSRTHNLIKQSETELYNWYSTYYKLSKSLYGLPLNLMVSLAGNLHFLIQFIRSHGFLLDDTIS